MCGILFCSWNKKKLIKKNTLIKSLDLLKRRGPDNYKLLYNDNWSIGHVRLSIIDPNSTFSNTRARSRQAALKISNSSSDYGWRAGDLRLEIRSDGKR